MLQAAWQFVHDLTKRNEGHRWLTFCGPSGIGKTHLARQCFNQTERLCREHPSLLNGSLSVEWIRLLLRLRDGEYWRLEELGDANLVLVDDFGTESPTGFALEKLYELVNLRCRKWTIWTCNLSIESIAKKIDTRIASRLIRDRNVVVNASAKDYALRK